MARDSISNSVIRRLPRYHRFLGELEANGYIRISSRELSEKMGLTASQIRQDFNCFGEFGQQGYGYNVSDLRREIGNILGLDKHTPMILIGAGNIGKAIASHLDFRSKGFVLTGAFDVNPEIIGKPVGEINVSDISELESFCAENKPVSAILCVPTSVAPAMTEKLISCGIKAFWNFTHYDIRIEHKNILVENVHLGDSLTTLSYGLNRIDEEGER
ncbi:redox-sensing transcriptional repressor Rex [uncultured Ruminococcus sp.]|uniref:redox-sensing transcriptional repressor Rex n=1 Tax=uncultured Ruminococcus sp. TaxID=165186 RepID=UPI00156720E3|nr:redox-sensing transcriptional repressor Rex [uncultured Ruminococcus sp.]